MPTKISRYTDGLIEACWLAALIIAPVFFDVFSSRIFEPDKITLLRTLALLILIAWVIKLVDQGGFGDTTGRSWKDRLNSFLRTPIVLPVLFLAIIYIIATLFSITPRASLFGSYQRLQGTYTTFSYLVIFAAVAANLRRRKQFDRIITLAVIVSLPVSLYGILQHYHLDPIPWGGDVSIRIASTLGNSIFIAAYLIMVFPLALGRVFESIRSIILTDSSQSGSHRRRSAVARLPLGLQILRASTYLFIAILQLVAIYMSGSRGPVLGLMAGVFFIFVMLAVWWQKRWLTLGLIAGVLFLGAFLLVFNLERGPLEALRASPSIGRFGLLLNADSNSALVRRYIWEGAAKLVAPHAPLVYPDGSQDSYNLVRPLVGYGPESMFVAYNPFYNPSLGQVERRNAAPDRSHNETWDSLVNAGLLGLIAYLWLFTSIFYFGLKWLGLIDSHRQRIWFFALYTAGGIAGGLVFTLWRGIEYLGVGLPFGLLLGLLGFVMLTALQRSFRPSENEKKPAKLNQQIGHFAEDDTKTAQVLFLIVLLSAIIAHFVEINFGIAISVTRTYFWIYTALLLLLGYLLPKLGVLAISFTSEHGIGEDNLSFTSKPEFNQSSNAGSPDRNSSASRNSPKFSGKVDGKKKRRGDQAAVNSPPTASGFLRPWLDDILVGTLLVGILLTTLGFDLIANQNTYNTALAIFWQSVTNIRGAVSYGVLAMILITWIVAAFLMAAEAYPEEWEKTELSIKGWARNFGAILLGSIVAGGLFWIWQSAGLAAIAQITPRTIAELMNQISRYEAVLTRFYIYLILLILGLAFALPGPILATRSKKLLPVLLTMSGAVILFVLVALNTNLRVIQADITFKLASSLTRPGSYPVAIQVYKRANQLAPNEDYYYLHLGRAYLDQARSLTTPSEQDTLLNQAAQDLKKAQSLNPLNTDHTANLARLYSLWASLAPDSNQRSIKAMQADEFFKEAVTLSPQNVRLLNEWAFLATSMLNEPEQAMERLERAQQIDPTFDWTYGQLGDLLAQQAKTAQSEAEKKRLLDQALSDYQKSLSLPGDAQLKYNYGIASGGVLTQLGRIPEAITAYEGAIKAYPQGSSAWQVQQVLAQLYAQQADYPSALQYANAALVLAPQDQKSTIQALIDQIEARP